ncbi:MAG TPA: hypothetical protein VIJ22_01930 [Polyangiaceae bacterium]
MTAHRDRKNQVAVRGVVDRVAVAYGAATVLTDAELGSGTAGSREVLVVPASAWTSDVEPADLVVTLDAPAAGAGWEDYLVMLAKQARKVLLVFAHNAERIGRHAGPGTAALARVLWQIGRVREHTYLGSLPLVGAYEVVRVPAGMLVRKTALLQAFVVDTVPRTPQARRRLRALEEARSEDP